MIFLKSMMSEHSKTVSTDFIRPLVLFWDEFECQWKNVFFNSYIISQSWRFLTDIQTHLRETLFKTEDEIGGWDPCTAFFCYRNWSQKRANFSQISWDTCIRAARFHEGNPTGETCMVIFWAAISGKRRY